MDFEQLQKLNDLFKKGTNVNFEGLRNISVNIERLERLNAVRKFATFRKTTKNKAYERERDSMNYGLPYQGSKSKVCEWLFTHIPKTDTFYDIFSGGGAVTDYAIRHKWFQKYYVKLCCRIKLMILQLKLSLSSIYFSK